MRRVLLLCVLLIGCSEASDPVAPAPAKESPPETRAAIYEILIDGEPYESASGRTLAPGTVIHAGGYWIRLGPPGAYRFRRGTKGADDADDLYEEQPSGEWARAGVTVRNVRVGKEFLLRNPLDGMTSEEMSLLRAVEIREPVEGLADMLLGIDPERCMVDIRIHTGDDWGRLPELPAGLRCLEFSWDFEEGYEYGHEPPDLASLRKLEHLQWFRLRAERYPFDLDLLENCDDLRELDLAGAKVWHPERLADFTLLRTLTMRNSRIRDLTSLSGHQHLEVIQADGSRLTRLPGSHLPALTELHVMGTFVPAEEVARFREANPQCKVSYTWDEILVEQLARATRVQVIDGSSNPRPEDELLFETADYQEVRKLIDGLVFDNIQSGGDCMCSGDLALVFSSDQGPIGRIGLKHLFTRLSWPHVFPGDAQLTDESERCLQAWLRSHEVDLGEHLRFFASLKDSPRWRRFSRYKAILPAPVMQSVEKDWDPEVLRVFAQEIPDETERAAACLRLLGVDEGAWNLLYGLDDDILDVYLPSVAPEALAAAVSKHPGDEHVLRGAARWFLGEQKILTLSDELRNEVLSHIARYAVASPRVINRQRAMTTLLAVGGNQPKAVLEEVAAGKIETRPLPDADTREDDDRKTPWAKEHPEVSKWDTEFAKDLLDRWGE